MRCGERGFSLIETVVAMAVVAMLLVAGGIWMLSWHPGALRSSVDGFDSSLAAARAIAASSGNGATIAFVPRAGGGFVLRVYSGRPNNVNAVSPTTVATVTSDASVRENTFGAPPFALFLSSAGHASGTGSYPSVDATGAISFPVIAQQPACQTGGIVLTFANAQGATDTRTLSCDSVVAGTPAPNASPTPNVPLLTPKAMLAHWTRDAFPLQFVATEWGYTHWFASATGMQCGNIATYPNGSPYSPPYTAAEGAAPPGPPAGAAYSYPNSNGESMNDAPARFSLQPIAGTPGLCTADIIDDYGQHATAAVQIMGDLTPSTTSLTFNNVNDPPQTVTFLKSYDDDANGIQLRFGGNCGEAIAYPPPTIATHIAPQPSAADPSTATISIQPKGIAAECDLTVSDQYGEPPVTVHIKIGHVQLRTWPLAVKYAQSGQTFLANVDTSHDPMALFNRMLGGAEALAASPCKAQAVLNDGAFSNGDPNPPSNVAGFLRGIGVQVNATGCFVAASDGVTPVNAPLTVWEPDGSTQTYTPSSNACLAIVRSGGWSPGATAPMASLDTAGGSGSGACTIALDDGSGVPLSSGHGLIAVALVGSQNYTIAWTWSFTCASVGSGALKSYKCNGTVDMKASMPDGTLIANCGGKGAWLGSYDPSGYNANGRGSGTSSFAVAPPHAWATWFQSAVTDAMNAAQDAAPADTFYTPSSQATVSGCP